MNGWISGIGRQWIHDRKMKGGLKHLDIWMYPLIFMFLSFKKNIFSRNLCYFLLDVGRVVKRRMKWIEEWRKMTYEKVWIKGVEWVGGKHG